MKDRRDRNTGKDRRDRNTGEKRGARNTGKDRKDWNTGEKREARNTGKKREARNIGKEREARNKSILLLVKVNSVKKLTKKSKIRIKSFYPFSKFLPSIFFRDGYNSNQRMSLLGKPFSFRSKRCAKYRKVQVKVAQNIEKFRLKLRKI